MTKSKSQIALLHEQHTFEGDAKDRLVMKKSIHPAWMSSFVLLALFPISLIYLGTGWIVLHGFFAFNALGYCVEKSVSFFRYIPAKPAVNPQFEPTYFTSFHSIGGMILPPPDSDGWQEISPCSVQLDGLSITKKAPAYEIKLNDRSVKTNVLVDYALHQYCETAFERAWVMIEKDQYASSVAKLAREIDARLTS